MLSRTSARFESAGVDGMALEPASNLAAMNAELACGARHVAARCGQGRCYLVRRKRGWIRGLFDDATDGLTRGRAQVLQGQQLRMPRNRQRRGAPHLCSQLAHVAWPKPERTGFGERDRQSHFVLASTLIQHMLNVPRDFLSTFTQGRQPNFWLTDSKIQILAEATSEH